MHGEIRFKAPKTLRRGFEKRKFYLYLVLVLLSLCGLNDVAQNQLDQFCSNIHETFNFCQKIYPKSYFEQNQMNSFETQQRLKCTLKPKFCNFDSKKIIRIQFTNFRVKFAITIYLTLGLMINLEV